MIVSKGYSLIISAKTSTSRKQISHSELLKHVRLKGPICHWGKFGGRETDTFDFVLGDVQITKKRRENMGSKELFKAMLGCGGSILWKNLKVLNVCKIVDIGMKQSSSNSVG